MFILSTLQLQLEGIIENSTSSDKGPLLLTFLEPFNEFDREERCEILFRDIDPNNREHFGELLKKEFFEEKGYKNISVPNKCLLSFALIEALCNRDFNFKWLVQESNGTFGLPSIWDIENFRQLFEEIYRQAYSAWKLELAGTGFTMPEPNELGIRRR
ncbi:hypothetical protein ACO0LM_19995 [Undibacterium sp. Di26W]|uniref:hypothetical protein n=1 Tax=Undibacterium sp. Di26W TaxID=3413035 RepID=UPI003BF060FD